jgi:glycosyltransferase involved in cell wall biosynthesis
MYPTSSSNKISVIFCALNEEKNLPHVLLNIPKWVDEVILVDGHSIDNTVAVANKLLPSIKVLFQSGKGKGDALKCGVASATGDIIVTLDADGTYPSEEMPRFVDAILEGYDFSKGTRFMREKPACMSRNRQFGNKILAMATNFLFRSKYTDVCSGYYAFRKDLFKKLSLKSNGFEMEQELFVKVAKMKFKVTEVPHSYRRRLYGSSKTQDFRQGFKDLLWICSLFFI